jgi:hypothetical protein
MWQFGSLALSRWPDCTYVCQVSWQSGSLAVAVWHPEREMAKVANAFGRQPWQAARVLRIPAR